MLGIHTRMMGNDIVRPFIATSLLALIFALPMAGCVSSPYVVGVRPSNEKASASPEQPLPHYLTPLSPLDHALQYADNLFEAYERKQVEEFERQQKLSGGLLIAGASLLGLASGSVHRDVLKVGALGSGVAYQLGTWNSNQGRIGIYLEGMQAVACAKAAIEPLRISKDQLKLIRDRSDDIIASMEQLAIAQGEVKHWLDVSNSTEGASFAPLKASAAGELADSQALASQANDLLARAGSLERRVEGAGNMLAGRLDDIRRNIDGAINGTLANLANLPKMIAGITEYANVFLPGISFPSSIKSSIGGSPSVTNGIPAQSRTPTPPPAAVAIRERLAKATGDLQRRRTEVGARLAILSGSLETMTADQVKSKLSQCSVDSARISSPIRLDRTTLNFVEGKSGTSFVAISGGTTPFFASLVDIPAKGITVTIPPGGSSVVVTADADSEVGRSYQAKVSDSVGSSTLLTISIEPKTPALKNETPPAKQPLTASAVSLATQGALCSAFGLPANCPINESPAISKCRSEMNKDPLKPLTNAEAQFITKKKLDKDC